MTHTMLSARASRRALSVGVLAAASFFCISAHAQVAPPTRIASFGGVTEYRLANGLRVLTIRDAGAATFSLVTVYLVGSRHEVPGEYGITHLMEHLMFTGTETHRNLLAEFGRRGASTNATTARDRTLFYITLPWNEANLSWTLDVEADRMVNLRFTADRLAKERAAVRQESAVSSDPRHLLYEAVIASAYDWHTYGHSPIGLLSDVERTSLERLESFYRDYYRVSNAVVIITCPVEPAEILDRVNGRFGSLQVTGRRETGAPLTEEPAQAGERNLIVRGPAASPTLTLALHVPAAAHPDLPSIEVAAEVLTGPNGRLRSDAITNLQYELHRSHDAGLLMLTAVLPKDHPEQAAADLERRLDLAIAEPPAKASVDGAKARIALGFARSMRPASRLALDLAEWAAAGDWRLRFAYRDAINRVDEASVKSALRYFRRENRTQGVLLPEDPDHRAIPIPAAPPIHDVVARYDKQEAPQTRSTSPPAAAQLLTGKLKNGLKYALRTQGNTENTASLYLFLHFGSSESLRNQRATGDVTARVLSNSLTAENVAAQFTKLGITANGSGTAFSFFVSMQGPGEHLPQASEILAGVLKTPAFDTAAFERARGDVESAQQIQSAEMSLELYRILRQALAQWPTDHVLYEPAPNERGAAVRAIGDTAVADFHRRFYGASAAELVATGAFDAAALRSTAERTLDGWESKTPFQRIIPEARVPTPRELKVSWPGARGGMVVAAIPVAINEDDPDYASLLVANQLLGGGFYGAVLPAKIRGSAGAAYRVSSLIYTGSWGAEPPSFMVTAMCAAPEVPRVIELIRQEMAEVVQHGRPSDEIIAARDGLLQSRRLNRSRDAGWLGETAQALFFGRKQDFTDELDEAISRVTADDVRRVLARYLDPKRMWVVATE